MAVNTTCPVNVFVTVFVVIVLLFIFAVRIKFIYYINSQFLACTSISRFCMVLLASEYIGFTQDQSIR